MPNDTYTSKTASLKTIKADIRKADIKKLNAEEIKINGHDIKDLWGLNLPEDYKKLVSRCELPDDKNWMIIDDNGRFIHMNFNEKITDGNYMFRKSEITNFNYDLPNLVNGNHMFEYAKKLTSFESNTESLIDGSYMFADCAKLSNFEGDLSKLENALWMFVATDLDTFDKDLSSLKNGERMFYGTTLSSFNCDLPNLINGDYMFNSCMLDAASLEKIANSINDVSQLTDGENGVNKVIDIYYGNATASEADSAKSRIEARGWRCNMNYNTAYSKNNN